jgi:peptidyl-prolyl cis-trans isomerase SurA
VIGRSRGLPVLLVLAAAAAAHTVARAQDDDEEPERSDVEVIERVVADVGDEAIFLSELRRRAVPFLGQIAQAPTMVEREAALEALYTQLLDHLVDEILIEHAATEMQVTVSRADVDRAIENVRRQSELDEDEFWNAVRRQGFTESQYREDVRRQLLKLKVLNQRARGRVNVDENAVRARYDQMVRRTNRASCFIVSDRFFPVLADAGATGVADVRRQAEAVRAEITPATFHDADNAVRLGRVCEGQMRDDLEDAIAGLTEGAISDPVQVPEGIHLFYLESRVGAAEVPSFESVRQQMAREMMEEAMGRMERQFLDELRRDEVIVRRL